MTRNSALVEKHLNSHDDNIYQPLYTAQVATTANEGGITSVNAVGTTDGGWTYITNDARTSDYW